MNINVVCSVDIIMGMRHSMLAVVANEASLFKLVYNDDIQFLYFLAVLCRLLL